MPAVIHSSREQSGLMVYSADCISSHEALIGVSVPMVRVLSCSSSDCHRVSRASGMVGVRVQ